MKQIHYQIVIHKIFSLILMKILMKINEKLLYHNVNIKNKKINKVYHGEVMLLV